MNTIMNDLEIKKLEQIKQFLLGTQGIDFKTKARREKYAWIVRTLKKFNYHRLRKKDKSTVRKYMIKITGYSRQQLTRLIWKHKTKGYIAQRVRARRHFPRRYTKEDIQILAKTDKYHQRLSGPATKKLFERAYKIYQKREYKRLARISVAHIYNLRKTQTYKNVRGYFTKTQGTSVSIGERRKPKPKGRPGYLRIDTVHQGDRDGVKGVYHINAVDEVTQMEIVCAVEKISEHYLIPVLEQIIEAFPFEIKGLHADNGSEYINKKVAFLLQKLFIELTKSRARHSNDNALVESKNASIVRKHLGYIHIQQKWAPQLNKFYKEYLNPYINYHRPCFFPITIVDKKGKEKKTYPYQAMMTPYEKLKSLPNAENYLKRGITFKQLDEMVNTITDFDSAKSMHIARKELFITIFDT
jgi:transposase InsO family protein